MKLPARSRVPVLADLDAIDASPVRCTDEPTADRMVAEIDRIRRSKDTVGGVFEVVAYGAPPGLGSYVHYDRKLDARLALALMSIQSVKGVEVGDGFASAGRTGSNAHDEIVVRDGRIGRKTARAGGIEGGMSTGQPIRVRAAMKPFSTVPRPLATVDLATGAAAVAIKQRTDVCAVPAGGVVGEAVVAFELANAVLEKFGGDSLGEVRRNLDAYRETLAMIVYLVGMPGAGKSVVGKELAGRLGVPFIDLDSEIERQTGSSVADIFAAEGEAAFRGLEAAALTDASTHDPAVVACGGGVVLEPANRITLRNTGVAVFLDVPLEELRSRVRPATDRPLIRTEGDLERLLAAREPLYREFAAHVVDGTASPAEVADAIVEELRWSA